jgi:hypothetical protein
MEFPVSASSSTHKIKAGCPISARPLRSSGIPRSYTSRCFDRALKGHGFSPSGATR